jgi:hypothetical protein
MALAMTGVVSGAGKSPGLQLWDIPTFNGYFGVGADRLFGLMPIGRDGKPYKIVWAKIGQKVGKFEIVSFDERTETLALKSRDFASISVGLVGNKIQERTNVIFLGR